MPQSRTGHSSPPSDRRPVLVVDRLTVSLPPLADRPFAVRNLSFTVGRGEILCVVGESGSGKSVTSLAIMGLLPERHLEIRSGRLILDGEDIAGADGARLRELRGSRISMIFQEPMTALNPVMTIEWQIEEVLKIHHRDMPVAERRRRVLDLLSDVHLPDPQEIRRAYPHQLSGGQRQRVMIAIALALDPCLLIADEPTTALDVTTQHRILRLIRELQGRHGAGVLFITHDFGVVSEIADRVVVMKDGEIVEAAPADEIFARPRHDHTRVLLAAIPGERPNSPCRQVRRRDVILKVNRLEKVYGDRAAFRRRRVVQALRHVSFEVRQAETLGIVGESGSGKSTIARCVARLISVTGGTIEIFGQDIARLPERQVRPHRRHVQIIFQDPYRSLNPRMSVGRSIVEGPVNFGLPMAQAWDRAEHLMGLVGLDASALRRYPNQFSGGQRQRICIARALALEPKLLIADEATSALDVSVQAQVLKLLDEIKRSFDLAVLFITHDLRVAAQVCDSILVMRDGRMVEYGDTAHVFLAPSDPYTRALLEAAPGRNRPFGAAPEYRTT